MVLEIVLNTLDSYLFGSRILLGLGILFVLMLGAIICRIDKTAIIILFAPLMIGLALAGFLPTAFIVVVFIGIFLLWGIMFKMILGKN